MDTKIKKTFIERWNKYFPNAPLPIGFYYSDKLPDGSEINTPSKAHCMMCELVKVQKGKSVYFEKDTTMCAGGRKYVGFTDTIRDNFEYFLSYGIPGELEGERYKKSPAIVEKSMKNIKRLNAPHKYLIFKRWDNFEANEEPAVVIFFAKPDVLSGLFTLANFDEVMADGVIAPFGSACSTIVNYPYFEINSKFPRAVLGTFDVSARPFVEPNTLSFAVPFSKLLRMIDNMDESFLITGSWNKLRSRMSVDI
jgi:uncharacterized protein (DUF169 family)